MDLAWLDRCLPQSVVQLPSGDIYVEANTFSFMGQMGVDPLPKDYRNALQVRIGPCSMFLSADHALAFAAALEAQAHHFIALATEAHAVAAA